MAEKRMFARSLIDSDAFLEMPLSAQALYFHLNMRADDDGFVNNPKRITDYVGAASDDLKLLLAKRFIIVFDSGVIVIRHWRMHNTLKSDRYHPTNYQEEFATLCLEENKAYSERPQTPPAAEPARVEKPAARPAQKAAAKPPEKKPYGEMHNVMLTDEELEKLRHDYPAHFAEYIQRLSLHIDAKGARYKSHYAVIRKWLIADGVKAESEKCVPLPGQRNDLARVEKMLAAMKGGAPDADHAGA